MKRTFLTKFLAALVFILLCKNSVSASMNAEEFIRLCRLGTPQQVREAVRAGADVNAQNTGGWTALMFAASKNTNAGVVTALLEGGANPNAINVAGETPLMLAISNSNPEILLILIENDADVTIKNKNGNRVLDYADVSFRKEELKRTGVYDLIRKKTIEGVNNATELLLTLVKSASVKEVNRLLQAGADVNVIDNSGKTPLMLAAWFNSNLEVMQLLIKNGADVNAADEYGYTPLIGELPP